VYGRDCWKNASLTADVPRSDFTVFQTGDRELADEVDRLTAINDDLKVLASQKYSRLLMEERSDGVDRVEAVAEENHAKEMDSIRNSIVTLRVRTLGRSSRNACGVAPNPPRVEAEISPGDA